MAFSEDLASARRISSPSQEEPLINLDLQSLQRYNDFTLEILKNIQEQDKRHQEKMQELDKRHRERIQEHRELMSINQSIITALSEMLITPKSLAEPKENPVSPTSHSGMLVVSTLLGSNSPSQVPQSIINLQPQPIPVAIDHDPGTNAYKHFPRRASLFLCLVVFTVINIVWKHQSASNKPLTDISHQANNIDVVLRPFRASHTALDLSGNFPRLNSNTREPLRLTPTAVLTSLRLAPVLPRPPSTALT